MESHNIIEIKFIEKTIPLRVDTPYRNTYLKSQFKKSIQLCVSGKIKPYSTNKIQIKLFPTAVLPYAGCHTGGGEKTGYNKSDKCKLPSPAITKASLLSNNASAANGFFTSKDL